MSETDLQLLMRAAYYASGCHRLQQRKDGRTPYIHHPLEVADLLARHGADAATIAAGLLHDVVEDTEATLEDIAREFGDEIASLVAEVTDDKSLDKMRRKELQIAHAPHISHRAKLIKLADKACNLGNMVHAVPQGWSRQRIEEYFNWADAVVAGLRGAHPGLEAAYDDAARRGRAALNIPTSTQQTAS
jgi:guanosine-3',5'-bis(diphosphate) 3'-pyrophosphohydrolase